MTATVERIKSDIRRLPKDELDDLLRDIVEMMLQSHSPPEVQ
jgi:hypothetical protein